MAESLLHPILNNGGIYGGAALKVSEVSIRLMETQNVGLDSIERRRVLATLLRIPPVLLGLSQIDAKEGEKNIPNNKHIASHHMDRDNNRLEVYKDAFAILNELYYAGNLKTVVNRIETIIFKIERDHLLTKTSDLMLILWEYHILCAKSYGYDLSNWKYAFKHLEKAFEIASFLDSVDLKATSFCFAGEFHLVENKIALAKSDLETALFYSKNATAQVQGLVTSLAPLTFTMFGIRDMAERANVYKLVNQSEELVYTINPQNDALRAIHFTKGRCLSNSADTFITLERYDKALEAIERAQEETNASDKRRLDYLNILRSELNIKQKKPDYEGAIILLTDVINDNKTMKNEYHIQYVRKLYRLLLTSPVKNSLELAELGMELRDLKS